MTEAAIQPPSEFVQFWNEILVPKFIKYKHVLVGGLTKHSDAIFPKLEVNDGERAREPASKPWHLVVHLHAAEVRRLVAELASKKRWAAPRRRQRTDDRAGGPRGRDPDHPHPDAIAAPTWAKADHDTGGRACGAAQAGAR